MDFYRSYWTCLPFDHTSGFLTEGNAASKQRTAPAALVGRRSRSKADRGETPHFAFHDNRRLPAALSVPSWVLSVVLTFGVW